MLIKACVIAVLCFTFLVFILLDKKHDRANENYNLIFNAVYNYRMHCVASDEKPLVNYSEIESVLHNTLRIWDWGYSKMLPNLKYEIIKNYI